MMKINSLLKTNIQKVNIFLIIVIACLVAVSIIGNYRFVKDDTGNIISFYMYMNEMTLVRLLDYIASNEWLHYQPRSFFLTWWVQIALIKAFGMNDLFGALTVYFAIFASLIHSINALLIYNIVQRFEKKSAAPFLIASIYLVLPAACMDYMISNNWFFLLPLFFTLCFSCLLLSERVGRYLQYFGLYVLLLCVMFSGEQLMAVPYFLLIAFTISIYFNKKIFNVERRRLIACNLLLIAIGIASYIFYIKVYAYSPNITNAAGSLTKNIFDIPSLVTPQTFKVIYGYTISTLNFVFRFFNIDSNLYGNGAIGFSKISIVLTFLTAVSFLVGLLVSFPRLQQKHGHELFKIFFFFMGLFISCMMPMYFGAISGNRPGPDDRYLMVPSLVLSALLALIWVKFIRHKSVSLFFLPLFFTYLALLTFHLNVDVWSNQKKLDERLWSSVNLAIQRNAKYILTINNDTYFAHRGLQRPYLSAAWTDFNADWGVTPRIKYETSKDIRLIHNIELGQDQRVTAIDYWGAKFPAKNSEIQVIYFNDGLDMKHANSGEISVMDLNRYLMLINSSDIPNRVIARYSK